MIDETAPTESDSARDGLLSYAVEWHALTVGIAVGFVAGVTGRWELAGIAVGIVLGVRAAPAPKKLRQLRREPWYALGGLVIGVIGAKAQVVADVAAGVI
jgi:hypothetical protein